MAVAAGKRGAARRAARAAAAHREVAEQRLAEAKAAVSAAAAAARQADAHLRSPALDAMRAGIATRVSAQVEAHTGAAAEQRAAAGGEARSTTEERAAAAEAAVGGAAVDGAAAAAAATEMGHPELVAVQTQPAEAEALPRQRCCWCPQCRASNSSRAQAFRFVASGGAAVSMWEAAMPSWQ